MKYLAFLIFTILLLYHAQNCFAKVITLEMDDCFISFIESEGNRFVVKQIKNFEPDEQFLLVLDALGCLIAETSNIPVNKVIVIPAMTPFAGKTILEMPATLHTFAQGTSTDKDCLYMNIDMHQRFRKQNSPFWHRWGPLSPEKKGLTKAIVHEMAKHSDLPKIAALDTFVGNADRSPPNLYYDAINDRFCGIDMAASFSSPLGLAACRQLKKLKNNDFNESDLLALMDYRNTLDFLIKNWPPQKLEEVLLEISERAGFKEGGFLFDQNLADRIEFHKRSMRNNYENCVELIKIVNLIIENK